MPTPSAPTVASSNLIATLIRSVHTTCPPEEDQPNEGAGDDSDVAAVTSDESVEDAATSSADEARSSSSTLCRDKSDPGMASNSSSPMSAMKDLKGAKDAPTTSLYLSKFRNPSYSSSPGPSLSYGPTQSQYAPSFLQHGSKFIGTQASENQKYNVQVEIKHVDMAESTLCGYLRIEGLTADHPTLTTFFDGEMIGTKYTFQTRHPEWGSTEKTDMLHWNRFSEWRPLARAARRSDFSLKNFADRENIFMRWKERFLVPDHSVRTINGASFEGFYYICFNQLTGGIDGVYFHHKSEKYQELKLKHIDDRGCSGAVEFR